MRPFTAISSMKIRLLTALLTMLSSCISKPTHQTETLHGNDPAKTVILSNTSEEQRDCHLWLADTVLSTGYFVNYVNEHGNVKIQWGNNHFKRTLEKDFDCDGAPSWVPTMRWSTSRYMGLKYGCGSPCWGSIILPTNEKDPVIERMYDLVTDTLTNRIVYLNNESYDKFVVENLATGTVISVDYGFDCKAAFVGYCIDTIGLDNDMLFVRWVEWINDGKEKIIKTEQFSLGL